MPKLTTTPAPKPKSPKKNEKPQSSADQPKSLKPVRSKRPVLYEEVSVQLCLDEHLLKAEAAKELLGWQEESENLKFGEDYFLLDTRGKKVRLHNNNTNRPFDQVLARMWQGEILHNRWVFTGESMVIGRTGLTLDCQHRLIGLVLAAQVIEDKPGQWAAYWNGTPAIPALLVYGVDESIEVCQVMNTGKPRSLMDTIFQSKLFGNISRKEAKLLAKATEHAVRLLWYRTDAGADAFSPKRTHSESFDFINRHRRLLDCIKHCYQENGDKNRIKWWLSVGYASAMMYLMACSTSEGETEDGKGYFQRDTPNKNEDVLDFKLMSKAEEFWVLLASNHKTFKALWDRFADWHAEGHTMAEKTAAIALAWTLWSNGEDVTKESLAEGLTYFNDDSGVPKLSSCPIVGGIDLGRPQSAGE